MKGKGCLIFIVVFAFLMGLGIILGMNSEDATETEGVKPILNVTEYGFKDISEFKEKYGEADYTDEDYSFDGFTGKLYSYNKLGCEVVTGQDDKIQQFTFYNGFADGSPELKYGSNESDVFKLFGLENVKWVSKDDRNTRVIYYGEDEIYSFDYTKEFEDREFTGVASTVKIKFNPLFYI